MTSAVAIAIRPGASQHLFLGGGVGKSPVAGTSGSGWCSGGEG